MADKFPGVSPQDLAQIRRTCQLTSVAGEDLKACEAKGVKRLQSPAKDDTLELMCELPPEMRRGIPASACKPKGRQH